MSDFTSEIRTAIDSLDMERARELLREALKQNPSAEIYYLASLAALNEQQKNQFLEKAIELDPFHKEANDELGKSKEVSAPAISSNQSSAKETSFATPPQAGKKTIFHTLETNKPLPQVKEAVKKSLILLGGSILEQGDSFQVKQGVNGVNFAFTANVEAYISVRQTAPNKYELFSSVNWTPNALFWVCLIVGFFVFGILWIIPLLYVFVDPMPAYQQSLYRVQNILG